MSLANKITEYRKKKGLDIDSLSALSGVPKGTLSKISAGITLSPTLDTVKAIARALGVTIDELDDHEMNEEQTDEGTKKEPAPEGEPVAPEIAMLKDRIQNIRPEWAKALSEHLDFLIYQENQEP